MAFNPSIRKHCSKCNQKTIHVFESTDHVFYFWLTILSGGIVAICWFMDIYTKMQSAKCVKCTNIIEEIWNG